MAFCYKYVGMSLMSVFLGRTSGQNPPRTNLRVEPPASAATMKGLLNILLLFSAWSSTGKARCSHTPRADMVHGFDQIKPSANLSWTPCFDNFTCSRLEVPLDYANTSLGTTSIAFIKLAGKNVTEESPSIVLIPGEIRARSTPLNPRVRTNAWQVVPVVLASTSSSHTNPWSVNFSASSTTSSPSTLAA